jgi:hypothetical protein
LCRGWDNMSWCSDQMCRYRQGGGRMGETHGCSQSPSTLHQLCWNWCETKELVTLKLTNWNGTQEQQKLDELEFWSFRLKLINWRDWIQWKQYESILIYCDNTVVICLSKNPILHSRAKHIEIKHHFIRDYVQKGIFDIQFIDTEHQWADIFNKPLTVERFDFIKKNLNMHFVSD